ncbi:MAG: MerC domain-containing protein [Betaproteobacteria bacterium]
MLRWLMRDLLKQLGSTAGAAFAAACCAGAGWALAALTAIGAGFLAKDAILIPIFVLLLAVSLWFLWRSSAAHHNLKPVYLGAVGTATALVGMWTSTVVLLAGLLTIMAASAWDFLAARYPSRPIIKEHHEPHD